MRTYTDAMLENTYVYDDVVAKGFIRTEGTQVKKLFVELLLQGEGIGTKLLEYAVAHLDASFLWALEKNEGAVGFYARRGFEPNGERRLEEGTTEYLIRLER